jgi:hypothetical protein
MANNSPTTARILPRSTSDPSASFSSASLSDPILYAYPKTPHVFFPSLRQTKVAEASKSNAPVLVELGFEIGFLYGLYHLSCRADGCAEATCFERRGLRCRNFDALGVSPASFVSLPRAGFQTSRSPVDLEHAFSVGFPVAQLAACHIPRSRCYAPY